MFGNTGHNYIHFSWPIFLYILAAVVVLLLLIREINCWYFKINHIVDLLESINKNLSKIANTQLQNDISSNIAQIATTDNLSDNEQISIQKVNPKKVCKKKFNTKKFIDVLTKEYHFFDLFGCKKNKDN